MPVGLAVRFQHMYELVENQRWTEAHMLAGGMVAFSFLVILTMFALEKRVGRPGR